MDKYKFLGTLGKSKYYVTENGWLAKSYRNKFIEMGYIEDNLRTYIRLCEQV